MRIMGECYVEWFANGLERRKGGRCELAQPNLFVVQMRENRFQAIARNITHIMRHFENDIPELLVCHFFTYRNVLNVLQRAFRGGARLREGPRKRSKTPV